jgi:hypothetical protein
MRICNKVHFLHCFPARVDTAVSEGEVALCDWKLGRGADGVVVDAGIEVPASGVGNLYFQWVEGDVVEVAVEEQSDVYSVIKDNRNAHRLSLLRKRMQKLFREN